MIAGGGLLRRRHVVPGDTEVLNRVNDFLYCSLLCTKRLLALEPTELVFKDMR